MMALPCMMALPYIFSSGIYLLYVQFSSKMGNIWYRNGYFVLMGALNLIMYPLFEIRMWNPMLWDINYFMWMLLTFGLRHSHKFLYSKILFLITETRLIFQFQKEPVPFHSPTQQHALQ